MNNEQRKSLVNAVLDCLIQDAGDIFSRSEIKITGQAPIWVSTIPDVKAGLEDMRKAFMQTIDDEVELGDWY